MCLLNKTFILLRLVIAMGLRNRRVDGFCHGCKQEYQAKYRNLIIQETSLEAHIRGVMNRFVQTGRVNKEKSCGRPSVSEEVVDNLDDLSRICKHL